ncbi:MAG: DNA cytosine methyltransferase [Bryobacteraceae bacterium]
MRWRSGLTERSNCGASFGNSQSGGSQQSITLTSAVRSREKNSSSNSRTLRTLLGKRPRERSLGVVDSGEVGRRIRVALGSADKWILCGGPPCQAFSVVRRSRNGGIAEDDHHVYLYKQYLRILSVHEPCLFIIASLAAPHNTKQLRSTSAVAPVTAPSGRFRCLPREETF